ncbi:hypothetical protein ACQUW5_00455 [Legionella sp. CNM-1927-20]|uniref:hypothetical protein n=1 Tax=Legionella sp. CNM-1927-20 TaxID=3422221 RepID=UPI00403A96F9
MVQFILKDNKLIYPITVVCKDENLNQIITLFELFRSSPICEDVLSVLANISDVKINFSQDNLQFQGQWSVKKKEIQVKGSLPLEKKLQTFIFELCNATNPALTRSKLNYSNFLTAEEYATYIEMAEYESFQQAISLYRDIVYANPGVLPSLTDKELQQFKILLDVNSYLEHVKKNGHYDHYLNEYDRTRGYKENSIFAEQNKNLFKDHLRRENETNSNQSEKPSIIK